MNVLFVDIDGVLITAKTAMNEVFDFNSIENLNDIVSKGKYKIIVLNNKRYPGNLTLMRDIFRKNGFSKPSKIIDIFSYDNKKESIKKFVKRNNIENYFVLDDEDLEIEKQFVIDCFDGITNTIKTNILEE